MPTIATPTVLTDAGYLFIAPLATAVPTNTVAGSVFTDAWSASWIPLGATEEGSTLSYSITVEPVPVAELFDPVKYATTERNGSIAFNLADFTLSNYRRALNGGTAALAPTSGTGATGLYTVEPGTPGTEVRCMIGWESLDATVRLVARQTIQGGEVASAFNKAPNKALIPCTFQMEKPSAAQPFIMWGAGTGRGGV
jgi:hypothetical protein